MLFNVANSTFDPCLHSVVIGDYHLQNNFLRGTEGHHFVGYELLCPVHSEKSRGFACGSNVGLKQGHGTLASFSVKVR